MSKFQLFARFKIGASRQTPAPAPASAAVHPLRRSPSVDSQATLVEPSARRAVWAAAAGSRRQFTIGAPRVIVLGPAAAGAAARIARGACRRGVQRYSTEARARARAGASRLVAVGCACAAAGAGAGYLASRSTGAATAAGDGEAGRANAALQSRAAAAIPYVDYEGEAKPAYYSDTGRPMHERMEALVLDLQERLVQALEALEPTQRFVRDRWEREDGRGYGISCVLQDGAVFEKAGVNVSVIEGTLTPGQLRSMRERNAQTAQRLDGDAQYDFRVAGVSVVVHPRNPFAPTAHKNFRRFEVYRHGDAGGRPVMAWFGGGADLTPAYLDDDDARHFHRTLKRACDAHDAGYYPRFKAWCDRYFVNTHRGETRGVGGIFFDDLEDKAPEDLFRFVFDAGRAFVPAYVPLVARRMLAPYTQRERDWQLIRRGRYVEFNLVHDRGTKFGLLTPGARIESILMSLPLTARWEYMHRPEPGSPEDALLQAVRTTRDWAGGGVE
ncbi:Coproporphyrinogen-III oxidase [Coemansia javaensis]|uniref:coproporphyrinogen oxidase n=1 Tax=Coemansia javaensis TaxID=2761396 RepID=A0A9W8LFH6_9FUNG|nr:Coproporphyrinogen-III oxidase [Coemansia javaensis]